MYRAKITSKMSYAKDSLCAAVSGVDDTGDCGVGVDNGENRLRVEMRSGRLRTVVTVELLDVVAVDVLMELVADDEGGAGADVAEESRGEWTGC